MSVNSIICFIYQQIIAQLIIIIVKYILIEMGFTLKVYINNFSHIICDIFIIQDYL
jgi:hypothetical protein